MTATDLIPGTTTLGPCVSLDTGSLRPDQRVNYAYGMVLGLDEFLQEQWYFLAKHQLHERALHGYGTVSGLAVATAPVDGSPDFQVSVTTGIAVDQWGREIVVRCDQCVRLGAWLAEQERLDPGILGQHLGPSGEVTVFVVASYAECLDRLVPLPGQPCSSSDKSMVASRVRDAWDLELRWSPPAMPRWDTDRRLARLLAGVSIVAGLDPADSDEAAITDAVRALEDFADDGPSDLDPDPGPSGTPWRLPAETAADALDRIVTVWVTEVRGALHPDLIEPEVGSDPAILLTAITFVPASPFDPNAPSIVGCDDPDDEGRPYLAHTQLLQELRWLGESAAAPPVPDIAEPRQLVTLTAQPSDGLLSIDAWFHLDDPVRLPDKVELFDETGATQSATTSAVGADPGGFSSVWNLLGADGGAMIADGLQIAVLLPADSVLVKDAITTLRQLQDAGLNLLDADEVTGDTTAYAEVRAPRAATATPPQPNVEFVTVTDLRVDNEFALIELWFHLQPHGVKDDVFAVAPALQLFDDTTGNPLDFQLSGPAAWSRNVWRAQFKLPSPGKNLPVYVRHQYFTDEFIVETDGGDKLRLREWIDKAQLTYLGFEPDAGPPDIIAFSRTVLPQEVIRALDPIDRDAPQKVSPAKAAPAKAVKAVRKAPARKSAPRNGGGR